MKKTVSPIRSGIENLIYYFCNFTSVCKRYYNTSKILQHVAAYIFVILSKIYSYSGEHYSVSQLGQVSLHLNRTANGLDWEPIGTSPFYTGGISEVGEY